MCIVHMRVRCSDKYSELLVDDVEYTELTIENLVSLALLEVFDTVEVENVTFQQQPGPDDSDASDEEQNGSESENAMT